MPKEIIVLFIFFAVFVFINFATYIILYLKMKEKIFRDLAIYWLLVFVVYIIEGVVHEGEFALSLIFIVNLFPVYNLANFLLHSYGLKLNLKKYSVAFVAVVLLTCVSHYFGMPFRVMAFPVSILTAFPLMEAIYITFVTKKNEAGFIQKFMAGVVFSSGVFCCINYAINRMVPGALALGYGSAFLNYIAASIVLPVFAIQELTKEKTEKLENMVKERTSQLLASKVQKEKLLRVVVHDISNSLQVLILQTNRLLQSEDAKTNEISRKMMKNLDAISEITKHVKEIEYVKSAGIKLKPVSIEECFGDIQDLFFERFANKNVKLTFINKVSKDTQEKKHI